MKHSPRILGLSVLLLSLVVLPLPARSLDGAPAGGAVTLLAPTAQPSSVVLTPKDCEDDCPAQPISCGETVMATLTTQDFQDDKGRYFDIYRFSGTVGQQITATLFSADFEPHLELRTPGGEDAAEAEGENPGTTARIDYTLTSTSDNWRLIAKGDDTGVTGGYSLTLQCGGGTPPPPPPPPPEGGSIACGQTVMSTISGAEPQDGQGRFFDIYSFSGTIGQQITATLFSGDFEPHLELLTPGGEDVAEAEGPNPGTTARIDYTLTSTSNDWRLEVKPDDAGATGAYSLTLLCGAAPPPPPPPPPPAGGSIACGGTVMSTISGAEPQDDQGRSFDLYRFIGTIGMEITASLFSDDFEPHLELLSPGGEDVAEAEGQNPGTTARIDYTLTSTSNNWRLEVKPDDAGVTGAYTLTLQCGAAPPPPPPPAGFFIDPACPDFQFRVRIGPLGSSIPGRREAGCQPETVCVSGALAGRSELFIRILGPRPNGFLWPTIVRFTPSRVVVDIRQVSTGQMNTYTLEAVPPGVEDLPGWQDRTGFLP